MAAKQLSQLARGKAFLHRTELRAQATRTTDKSVHVVWRSFPGEVIWSSLLHRGKVESTLSKTTIPLTAFKFRRDHHEALI